MRTQSGRPLTSADLLEAIGIQTEGLSFDGIGDIHADHASNLLSFVKNPRYCKAVDANENISGVLCTPEIAAEFERDTVTKILCDDPNYCFFKLVDYRARHHLDDRPSLVESEIDPDRNIVISPVGVTIGQNVGIGPNVTILAGVEIGDGVTIGAGAVLGCDSFQHQRTARGIVSPAHDGKLVIGPGAEIGANNTISIGFSYRNTLIGPGCRFDAQVYVAHGVEVGEETFLCAGSRIMGHAKIGARCWVGPGAVVSSRLIIGDEANISLGSVVTQPVDAGKRVTGNFAVEHENWIAFMRSVR